MDEHFLLAFVSHEYKGRPPHATVKDVKMLNSPASKCLR